MMPPVWGRGGKASFNFYNFFDDEDGDEEEEEK